ncbi:hypothetical protein OHW24_16080 [Acinetobacter baumannii]|nr:hypothetical protein [Acinetobacter baumannii]
MKFYKLLICISFSLTGSACQSLPPNMQTLGSALNNTIKDINGVLTSSTAMVTSTTNPQKNSANRSGMLTNAQCQSAQGKTKAQIEALANEKLTDTRAYSLNSFAVTYNFLLSDRISRYGVNSASKSICSLTFEGNQPSSKVLHWSIIG